MNRRFVPLLAIAPLALAACTGPAPRPAAAPLATREPAPLVALLPPPPELSMARTEASEARVVYPYNLPQYNDLDAEIAKATASPR